MKDVTRDFIRKTSVGLPDGGDTHFHPWENRQGFTVTTRLPGGLDFHTDFSLSGMLDPRAPMRPR